MTMSEIPYFDGDQSWMQNYPNTKLSDEVWGIPSYYKPKIPWPLLVRFSFELSSIYGDSPSVWPEQFYKFD